ncbi:putative RNA-directed DNA polymerase [Senna tora]|uniref:Putative RNA-directed DNA polymerase n=1 Tax=Senna tora TaxID=362788 RepID=A0A834WD28_9FABA|nr:putative RNA-directed DNA polymerase [Senna tora]
MNVQVKTFNASRIRSYYNLPHVEECRYEELKGDDKNFPWNEIEEELGACWDPQEGSKRYILRSDMNATARIWLILVANNIKPSKYLTKISRNAALLLYLLMTNQPVKLEAIIYKSLCKVAYNGRARCPLIFPHMISDFYFNVGVLADDTDAKFKPKQQLDYKRVGKGRVDPDDPCTSEVELVVRNSCHCMTCIATSSLSFGETSEKIFLSGNNYKVWKESILLHLGCLDLDYALRKEEPPVPTAATSIRGSIPDKEKVKDYMQAIDEQFASSDKSLTSTLMAQLSSMKYTGTKAVREHIMQMRDIAAQLKSLDIEITDSFLVHLILNSLPSQFGPFKITYNTQKEKWSVNELLSMCVQEEGRLNFEKGEGSNEAHIVTNTNKQGHKGKNKKNKLAPRSERNKDVLSDFSVRRKDMLERIVLNVRPG